MRISRIIFTSLLFFLLLSNESFPQGKIVISPEEVRVGQQTKLEIKIFPHREIKEGGEIIIHKLFKVFHGFININYKNIYVYRSDLSDGKGIEKKVTPGIPKVLFVLRIKITEKSFPADGFITVVLGDEQNKIYADRKNNNLHLSVGFIYEKGGEEKIFLFPIKFKILNGKPSDFVLVGPSFGIVNEPVDIIICALDKRKNVCQDYAGDLEISVHTSEGTIISDLQKHFMMSPLKTESEFEKKSFRIVFSDPGIYFIMAEDKFSKIKSLSNPVKITEIQSPHQLYWGDLHLHTMRSDGKGEVEDCYRDGYTKGMDFIAITDHGFGFDDRGCLNERFSQVVKDAERFNRPGEYVAIPAGEVHWLERTHINLYFSGPEIDSFASDLDCFQNNFNWTELKKKYVKFPLAFTHHSLWQANSDFIDDDRMRLIEIYSMHGSSESRNGGGVPQKFLGSEKMGGQEFKNFSVQEILNKEKILGIMASSDSHSGQAGEFALAAVWAPELTRAGILNALYNRSCYGTTGNRTIIELTVSGYPMGSIIPKEKTKSLDFDVFVAGDGLIKRVDIIGNSEVVYSIEGEMKRVISLKWSSNIPPLPAYYYLRVILEDGLAWSSPVWVR